jgi:large subunit ribosomal protein L3
MINGIIGRKIGMTQIFAADGSVTPVTVIKAGPCVVVQKKSASGPDGYDAVQLGLVDERPVRLKNVTKPMRGHFEKTGGGIPPTRILKEFRLTEGGDGTNVGDKVLVDQFSDGEMVDVIGRSKGRGFAGTVKRHHFNRGPESHGSMNVRAPGSIGASAYPSRVVKGNRSSGHMGDARITTKGLTVARVDAGGVVTGLAPGKASIKVTSGTAVTTVPVTVVRNPVASLAIEPATAAARTGDVVRFKVAAQGAGGARLEMPALRWSVGGGQAAHGGESPQPRDHAEHVLSSPSGMSLPVMLVHRTRRDVSPRCVPGSGEVSAVDRRPLIPQGGGCS